MRNVVQNSHKRAVRWSVGLFLGALVCLVAGALFTQRVSGRKDTPRAQPERASAGHSADIDRLKQTVSLLEQKSAVLAAALASPNRDAIAPRGDDAPNALPEAPKAVPEATNTRSAAEFHRDEITDLEARFASEPDGSRDGVLAARTLQAELAAAPLSGARVTGVACSASLCRATLEHDVNAVPLDMTALIQATPNVQRESIFSYDDDGSVKRVTIYSAREGHRLNPAL